MFPFTQFHCNATFLKLDTIGLNCTEQVGYLDSLNNTFDDLHCPNITALFCTTAPHCRCTALDIEWVVWKVEVDWSKGARGDNWPKRHLPLLARLQIWFSKFWAALEIFRWQRDNWLKRHLLLSAAQSCASDLIFQVLGLIVCWPQRCSKNLCGSELTR